SFIDLTGTEKLWGNPVNTVKKIQKEIKGTLNLPSTVGMGPNMLMAKLALDLEAKKSGFAKWRFEDIQTKLCQVSPLREMWGIGKQTEKALNKMNIFTVGDLAHADLAKLESQFGIMGNQLYYDAWDVDLYEIGTSLIIGQEYFGNRQINF